jgi:hypothetical protein
MKIEFTEHCNLYIYKWHSINLVPHMSVYDISSDKWDGTIIGRCIGITIFGIAINFMYPSQKIKKHWSIKVRGPLYSRKRRCWYHPYA